MSAGSLLLLGWWRYSGQRPCQHCIHKDTKVAIRWLYKSAWCLGDGVSLQASSSFPSLTATAAVLLYLWCALFLRLYTLYKTSFLLNEVRPKALQGDYTSKDAERENMNTFTLWYKATYDLQFLCQMHTHWFLNVEHKEDKIHCFHQLTNLTSMLPPTKFYPTYYSPKRQIGLLLMRLKSTWKDIRILAQVRNKRNNVNCSIPLAQRCPVCCLYHRESLLAC
jgi:hypothetical protein